MAKEKATIEKGMPDANSFESFHVDYSPENMSKEERENLLNINIREELNIIADELENFHGLFYQLFEMGSPRLTFSVPTAAVGFDKDGKRIDFMFNPVAWKFLDNYTKSFVIAHECLHVMLNHGIRIKDCPIPQLANIALDIVVNHMLVSKFGFNRASIDFSFLQDGDKPCKNDRGDDIVLCWIDTVFKDRAEEIKPNKPFEYYYYLLEQNVVINPSGGMKLKGSFNGKGSGSSEENDTDESEVGGKVLDDHSLLKDFGDKETQKEISDKLNNNLSDEEKEDISKRINKTEEGRSANESVEGDEDGSSTGGREAGSIAGQITFHTESRNVQKKRKWETVIKKWTKKFLTEEATIEQWARQNRRLATLDMGMLIPSEYADEGKENAKIDVIFYQDFSGSCYHLAERFFRAAKSLPSDKFNVKLFCFDTKVYPIDSKRNELYGGRGTSFSILETHIQNMLKKEELAKYPDAIFVITDGEGDHIAPQSPSNWYWFLGGRWTTDAYIPKKSQIYQLADFE